LTNHAQVLFCLLQDPTVRLRDVADRVGITERATQSIVADLVTEGYVSRTRVGRRNTYQVHIDAPLRRDDATPLTVGGLMAFLGSMPRTMAFAGPNLTVPGAHITNGDAGLN
jgi:hypothetical protein